MRIELVNPYAKKKDIEDICIFLRKKWKGRKDTMTVLVKQGTHDCSVDEVIEMMNRIFGDDKFEYVAMKSKGETNVKK